MNIDREFAAGLVAEVGVENLRMVSDAFGEDVARLVAWLRSAASSGDLDGFRQAVHGLSGAAAAVGAAALDAACREAMGSEAPDLVAVAAGLTAKADAAIVALDAFLDSYSRP